MERVVTGVPGFDELVEGGLPRGSTTLLTGTPGTGKTIFGLQYLLYGMNHGEPGIYVYAESSVESIKEQAMALGLDLDKAEEEGKIAMINVPLEKKKFDLLYLVEEKKKQVNAKRIVFDSLATFTATLNLFTIPLAYAGNAASGITIDTTGHGKSMAGDDEEMKDAEGIFSQHSVTYKGNMEKRLIYIVMETLRRMGTTNVVITFSGEKESRITIDGISEYVADGIVVFYNELVGARHARTMAVLKMRNTSHSPYINPFDITSAGMIIKPAEQVYK